MKKKFFTKLIVLLSYVFIPLIAFSYKFFIGNSVTKYLYDFIVLFLGIILLVLFIQRKSKKITKKAMPLILIGIVMLLILLFSFIIKVYDSSIINSFYIFPFILEVKLPLYLLIIGLAYIVLQPIDSSQFVYYSRAFSFFVIIDVLLRFILSGELVRPTIASESNYDGVFILLGLCALLSNKKTKAFLLDYVLFAMATFLTQSKTGIGCLIILSFIHFATPRNLKYLALLFCLFFVGYSIVVARLSAIDDLSKVDRFAMWFSYIDLIKSSTWLNILTGYLPGFTIKESDPYLWWFIENQSEKVGAQGLHAFNYHSLWLRLATTYGLIFTGFIMLYFLNFARQGKPYMYFSILVLLQGFSMGVFYLSVNLLILCMYYIMLTTSTNLKKIGKQ